MNIHALSGNRTRNPSNRAAAELHLSRQGHTISYSSVLLDLRSSIGQRPWEAKSCQIQWRVGRPPRAAESKGRQNGRENEYFNRKKKTDFRPQHASPP
jgi:hypothetical protein